MEAVTKPMCEYGAKCYRKNPNHFKQFSHSQQIAAKTERGPEEPKKKKPKLDTHNVKVDLCKKVKQTKLNFLKKPPLETNQKIRRTSPRKTEINTRQPQKDDNSIPDSTSKVKKLKTDADVQNDDMNLDKGKTVVSDSEEESDSESEKQSKTIKLNTNIWTYIKQPINEDKAEGSEVISAKTHEEVIKQMFLVDMPPDFYSFYKFCSQLHSSQPLKALISCGLALVGPFDVLADRMNASCDQEKALCHWRYFYDPPEFQTVLSGSKSFHMGYWRDDPKILPVFVASNQANKDCIFKIEAENLFGALYHFLEDYIKTCSPFDKIKVSKLQTQVAVWAEKHEFPLDKKTDNMKKRQKQMASKTLHRAGMVVPIQSKTELGYRPLIETEANLKKICKLIMDNSDEEERESLWENLQPLINAANIANDECDFGNGLELGIDLFCMGSTLFHATIEHLMCTSYSLLNRPQFGEIVKAHLKYRRSGSNLSMLD